jgi:hypothetical protein
MAICARTPSSPTTRSTQSPSTDASPCSSSQSSTKNATASARSSTTMPTWSIRWIVMCSMVGMRPSPSVNCPGGRTGRLEHDIRAARSCFGAQTSIPAAHDKHHALRADSEHDARERSTAELDAPNASQALGCCKHESSSRAVDVALPVSDNTSRATDLRRRTRPTRRAARYRAIASLPQSRKLSHLAGSAPVSPDFSLQSAAARSSSR